MKLKKFLLFVPLILSSIIVLYSSISIFLWLNDKYKTDRLNQKLKDMSKIEKNIVFENYTLINPPEDKNDIYWDYADIKFLQVNFEELLKENEDTVGWIVVSGTNVDYPIVQTSDNEYYLTHSFDKSKNKVGWIFSDFRNDLDNLNSNTIIYGHGRRDYTMFGSLRETLKNEWFQDTKNHIIKLSTPRENTIWQIVSVYEIPKELYYIKTYFKDNSYQEFLDIIISRSKFNFNTRVNTDDKILTLSTCQDTLGNRIVVHAKLIKKGTRLT